MGADASLLVLHRTALDELGFEEVSDNFAFIGGIAWSLVVLFVGS